MKHLIDKLRSNRRLDAEAEIIVLERGPQLSYGACGFPYFISGEVKSMDSFDHTPQGALRDSNYFAAVKGIDARCGCNVQKIDREQKCVLYLEKGELKQLSYDVLVLATGSTPVKLPLPNADAAGIHSFWFPWDVEAVDKEIAEGGVKDVVSSAQALSVWSWQKLLCAAVCIPVFWNSRTDCCRSCLMRIWQHCCCVIRKIRCSTFIWRKEQVPLQ